MPYDHFELIKNEKLEEGTLLKNKKQVVLILMIITYQNVEKILLRKEKKCFQRLRKSHTHKKSEFFSKSEKKVSITKGKRFFLCYGREFVQ